MLTISKPVFGQTKIENEAEPTRLTHVFLQLFSAPGNNLCHRFLVRFSFSNRFLKKLTDGFVSDGMQRRNVVVLRSQFVDVDRFPFSTL